MRTKHFGRFAQLLLTGLVIVAFATMAHVQADDLKAGSPSLPHAFYGDVLINGQPAPSGTSIEARGSGVEVGVSGNPLTTTAVGSYGGPGGFDPKLVVQGEILDGAAILFYVNGTQAECAIPGGPWTSSYSYSSGAVTELDLRLAAQPTATNTAQPTATNTAQPTATNTAQPTATNTAQPTATTTAEITNVAKPTATNTPRPAATNTPRPTATNTRVAVPTSTPYRPSATPTATPTEEPPEVTCEVCGTSAVDRQQDIVLLFSKPVAPDDVLIAIDGLVITNIRWNEEGTEATIEHETLSPLQFYCVVVTYIKNPTEPITLLDCTFESGIAEICLPLVMNN